jgi:cell division protein DivIC
VLPTTVALSIVFGSTFLQVYRLEREAARLEQMKRDLETQNALLRDEVKLLHTSQYIEKVAREQLGLVKPGEISLLIVPAPTDASPPAPPRPPTGWVAQLWQTLRHLFDR